MTPTAPRSLPAIPGAVSQAVGAKESRGVGRAVLGNRGAPGAGMDRGSRDSAAPSVRSSSIFRRGIMRASRLPPPWTGLFASPSRRARRAVLCWATPASFDPVTAADAGSWRWAGKSREPQGAVGRKPGRAGRARGQPAEPGGCLEVGICDPSHSLRRTLPRNAVAHVTHQSAPRGSGCGLGTLQGAVSPGGAGMHLQAAHSPAGSGAEASWEPWPGTGLLESARDLLPCQWLPGKGDSD